MYINVLWAAVIQHNSKKKRQRQKHKVFSSFFKKWEVNSAQRDRTKIDHLCDQTSFSFLRSCIFYLRSS